MPSGPYNPQDDAGLVSSSGATESRAFVAHYQSADPALGTTTAVHASAVAAEAGETVTTGITNPDYPRNLTVTPGGTAGDIATGTIIFTGTDAADATITESFATVANTTTLITGSKAFKTVTQYVISAQDGAAAEFAVGTGAKLGLHHCLDRNTVIPGMTYGTAEGTDPTVATSATVLSSNTITLNTALDGTQVDCYYLVVGDD
jgi:hypothetical protein